MNENLSQFLPGD